MFGSSEILGLLLTLLTFFVLASLGLTSRSGRLPFLPPVLVLKRFRVNEAATDGVLIDISGRPKGLVAWLLNVLRLDDETRMQVTATTLSIRRASLQGQNLTAIPLTQVGSTSCGFRKPLGLLAIGIFIAASGLLSLLGTLLGAAISRRSSFGGGGDMAESLMVALVLLIVAALFILAYFLRKEMVMAVGDNTTSRLVGLTFRPSVIEGVSVDINRVTRAIELLNRRVLEAQLNREAVAAKIPAAPAAEARGAHRAPARATPRCSGCGAVLEADSQFCAECGRAVEP
jgi:hypothetical protein